MARIDYPAEHDLSPKVIDALEGLANLNIFKMMAHNENLLGPFTRLGGIFLYKGSLDPVQREIAILRVGHLSQAGYEVQQHERIGRELGMSDELLAAIRSDPSNEVFTPLESTIMQFTDELVHSVRATDATFEAMRDQFSDSQVQEFTLLVGYYMMVCRFLETFGVDLEGEDAPSAIRPKQRT